MEETVKRLFNESVKQRIINLPDSELKEFIDNQLGKLKASSLKNGDIADYVKSFSDLAKERFNQQLQNKDSAIAAYTNMLTTRHSVAHTSTPSQVTFLELEKAVEAAKEILKAVQSALQSAQ